MSDMLLCPLCGKEPQVRIYPIRDARYRNAGNMYAVHCSDQHYSYDMLFALSAGRDGCPEDELSDDEWPELEHYVGGHHIWSDICETKKAAISAWNRLVRMLQTNRKGGGSKE